MSRWQTEIRSPNAGPGSGIQVFVTRKGLEVFGWYDSFVGVDDPMFISWEEIAELRRAVDEGREPARRI